jgi:hypothetical protein
MESVHGQAEADFSLDLCTDLEEKPGLCVDALI